jgi:hypothetical protein
MVWNSVWPIGNISVKDNRAPGQQNTTYIETNMGGTANNIAYTTATKDHFWNQGADLSGHHRFFKAPGFTVGGVPANPGDPGDGGLGTSIDGIMYLKTASTSIARVEMFYRNGQGIYQIGPSYQTGTVTIAGNTIQTIVAMPANVYGHIFMVYDADKSLCCEGIVSSSAGQTRGFTSRVRSSSSGFGSFDYAVELLNDPAGGLNLRCRQGDGSSGAVDGVWTWYLTYRAQ